MTQRTIDEQLAFIRADVAATLKASGMLPMLADAQGELIARRYANMAKTFPEDGGPEEHYLRGRAEMNARNHG